MPEASKVAELAEQAVDVVRDALARVEEQAQRDDDVKWLDASRRFALVASPVREYLNGVQMGRDQPHFLARKLEPLLAELDAIRPILVEAGLDDHLEALRVLAHHARLSSSR